ncbi:MAG: hypothetical protein WDN30_04010 [Pararobbsia sp.]
MLDDIERADKLEARVGERQRGDPADLGIGAVLAQVGDGRGAEVDEPRVLDRQARPQARCDFEPVPALRDELGDEGPGIEARCFDEARAGPQRIVEGAVGLEEPAS